MAHRNVKLLDIYTIFASFLFVFPVIVPYYIHQIGLTFEDFLIAEAVFSAMLVVLEVPSGWVSDVWERKYVLVFAALFRAGGFAILLFANNLLTAIIAQATIATGYSLLSGTNTALLYDSLLSTKQEKSFSRLEGRRNALGLYAIAGASFVGGVLYMWNPKTPIYGIIIAQSICMILAFLMNEPPRSKSAIQGYPLKDMWNTAKYAIHGHVEVGIIILISAVLLSGTKLIMWVQQPYYMELNVSEYAFGIFMAFGFVFGGISSHMSHKLDGKINNLNALLLSWFTVFLVCFLSGTVIGWHGIPLLMIGGSCIFGLAVPRVQDAINKRIPSDRRATVLSTASFCRETLFIPLSILFGWIVQTNSLQTGLLALTAWLFVIGLLLMWGRKRVKI